MKKICILLCLLLIAGAVPMEAQKKKRASRRTSQTTTQPKKKAVEATEINDALHYFNHDVNYVKKDAFIVISKLDLNLRVYAPVGGDTVLLAQFPVCLSKNKGDKQRKGDMRTPESPAGKPFSITAIQDASGWTHDFKDGRGAIKAYGHWFMRLLTPGHSGIGIHGSTNNESSVPGRASEGCIRLLDNDIMLLKDRYAFVGMKVIIKGEDDGLLPFEK